MRRLIATNFRQVAGYPARVLFLLPGLFPWPPDLRIRLRRGGAHAEPAMRQVSRSR